jgi:hypothetical protein
MSSSALRVIAGPSLVAVPAPRDLSTYRRLEELHAAAKALVTHIETYRHTPALPACAEYREQRMALVEEAVRDMQEAIDG